MYREELSDEGTVSSGSSFEVDTSLKRSFKTTSTGGPPIAPSTGNEVDSSTMTEYLELSSAFHSYV